jgi:tRNA pseudouridine38-40 synthase
MGIAYDGRDFHGWAAQPESMGLRTVQGEMQRVLGHLFGQQVEIQCAGRTDAGVHARGQVAHMDVTVWPEDVDAGRINRALPDDVRVTSIERTSMDFDARFGAIWRRYTYRVNDDPRGPDPLRRHLVLAHHKSLDIAAMNEAARALLGEHDFAPFCKQREFASTIRTLQRLEWARDDDGAAVMTVQADAFCHSMVRALVGVMLPVGEGRRPVTWPGEVLARGEKDSAVTVMPAFPLVLEEVGYPPEEEWASRQRETRAVRSLD